MCYNIVMTRSDTLATLRDRADALRAQGVTALYLFGSAARGEAQEESDVDLFVAIIQSGSVSWSSFAFGKACRSFLADRRT